MRLVSACLLTTTLVFVLSVAFFGGGASALMPAAAPTARHPLVRDAKFVCGDFGEGFTCKHEGGAVRRSGKTPRLPSSPSNESPLVPPDSGKSNALPPAPGDTGTSSSTSMPPPRAVPATCPNNSELLGGHCIPYTQRCTKGVQPTAYPPQCRGEEKQVCNFHPDGSKDCCCRTYSKF